MVLLEYQNPWWEEENWYKRDKHLKQWKNQEIKWIPKWVREISLKPFSLNFVIGPRQVGKTTGIKLLIKELYEKVKSPFQIFYLDLELIGDLKEFREILRKYVEIKREKGIKSAYIFLDEVTKLPGWDRMVKGFIDLGLFENDVIVVSGSSSLYLLKYADSFPGRRGYGKDIYVLPLSFPEFLEVYGVNLEELEINSYKLEKLFNKYLEVGGFPLSINNIPFYEDFLESLEKEILEIGKSVNLMREIISSVLDIIPSSFSFNSLS